jgi:hypothetical protein
MKKTPKTACAFLGHSEPARTNQRTIHPLDARYYSVVDEPQLSLYFVSLW